jgi:BirA family transcriptional regulator, biotin operon repressor / biotin---[acetyl-CoA-carboxylase] ligase
LYKIPANTLFLGKNLVYVPQCHSTNTIAAELSQNEEIADGTLVITDNQTQGRGQRGNTWEAAAGQNLTLSLILLPRFMLAKDQFNINRAISLGLADYLRERTPFPVAIKWPNDVIIHEKKIGGILIENHISGTAINFSIAGIGVNINQESFQHPGAISLRMTTGQTYLLNDELALLLERLERRYLELRRHKLADLENSYLEVLYRRNEMHTFKVAGNERKGIITGVDDVGRLRVRFENEEQIFGAKEISFL